ncbi:MAG: thioredoxin [Bacteroidetes bacterium]|nr:MAG: thioredoxin [Bacteroidota bacterium]
MIIQLTIQDHEKFENQPGRVVIKFYADWCPDCRLIKSMYEELSDKYSDIKFGQVNIDKESEEAA